MRFNRIFLLLILALSLCLGGCATRVQPITVSASEETERFVDTLIFLGDSTTAHMSSRAPLRDGQCTKQLWVTKNRYLNLDPRITYARIVLPETGEELTIAEAANRTKPPFLVITLGIDYGVYYFRNDLPKFRYYYEKLLDAITDASPETVLVLQSIFPVARECACITNEMIDRANAVIAEIAAARSLVYVDANGALKDEEGYLAQSYCSSSDGIHLTSEAYDVILKNLEKYEERIKKTGQ